MIVEIKLKCTKCGILLEDEDNYNGKINYCEKCQINLCDDCIINHRKNHPNHNIRIIKRNILKSNDNNILNKNDYLKIFDKCISCKKRINIRNNIKINYCNNCKGNLCDNCKDLHYSNSPGHIILYPKVILYNENEIKKENENYSNKNIPNITCIICKTDLINQINSPIEFCYSCQGNLCKKCSLRHINEYPVHQLELKMYLPDIDYKIYYIQGFNCPDCGNKIKIINNEDINHCSNCNEYICLNCDNQHIELYPTHNKQILNIIIIDKNKNIFEIPNLNCIYCNKNLEQKINNNFDYCSECNGILCEECINAHNLNNPKHNLKIRKYLCINPILEEEKNNFDNIDNVNDNKIKCVLCSKKVVKKNDFDYCNKCMGILCDSCKNNHDKGFPGHILIIKVYYAEKYNKTDELDSKDENKCKLCFKKLENSKKNYCDTCKSYLCEECSNNHIKKYPKHIINLNKKYLHIDKSEINVKNKKKTSLKLISEQCYTCGVLMTNKINLTTYICNYCNESFCNKCINSHYKRFPSHNREISKNASQPNISSKYLFLSSEFETKCNICEKHIIINSNKSYFYCTQCKIKICKDCLNNHKIKFKSHNIIILKNENIEKVHENNKNTNTNESNEVNYNLKTENINKDNDKICSCLMCEIPHSKYPSRFYYTCTDCNNYICSLCQKKHDMQFYSHILINPHKFGEEFKKINKKKNIQRRFASVGAENNIKDKNRTETKYKVIHKNESVDFSGKKACFRCKIINKKVEICNKCNKYYCHKCIRDGQHICKI